jgi:endonuclease/exonuclease/phosphatase family metal-dependent hydrolase
MLKKIIFFYKRYPKLTISFISLLLLFIIIVKTNLIRKRFKNITKLKVNLINSNNLKNSKKLKKLKVMSYNIQFAGAIDRNKNYDVKNLTNSIDIKDMYWYDGGTKLFMSKKKSIKKFNKIIDYIIKIDPDVIFLQEICKWTSRTGGYDQVKYLKEELKKRNTSYNYFCYASIHKVKFIPVLKFMKFEGKTDMGNMIISKYPISNAKRHKLAIRKDTSAIERFFDLRRNALTCDLNIEGYNKTIFLLNSHISAWALDNTKNLQMNKIHNIVMRNKFNGKNIIFGGDFNTVPPGTLKTVGHEDGIHINDFIVDESLSSKWIHTFILDFNHDFDIDIYKADTTKCIQIYTSSKIKNIHINTNI